MGGIVTPLIGVLIGSFIVGSIYALIAMGLSLLWSTVGLPNFAHGAILVLGAYVSWYFITVTGSPYSMILMLPLIFAFGLVCDRVLFKKVRYRADAGLRLVLITLTLAIIIEQVLNLTFGGVRRRIPTLIEGSVKIGNIVILNQHLLVFTIAVFTLILTYLVLTRTVAGIAIRAVGQNVRESMAAGVNVERIYLITVGIGFMLAGIAGLLMGSMYIFNAAFGRAPLLIGFIVVVLGGMGSIKGTVYASYLVAAIEALTTFFLGGSWRIAIPFLIMILILLIRPYGLFGIKEERM